MSLKDLAVLRIREAIELGELTAGTQVKELDLAKRLGVGQPTIREALLELEFVGFIERVGPRKTRVTHLSRQQIGDIYLVRSRLELLAVELLAASSGRNLDECRQRAQEMKEHAAAGDVKSFYQADLEFHRALWKATRNETISEVLERLVPKLFAFGLIQHVQSTPEVLKEVADLHGQLLDLIKAGDVAESQRLMQLSMGRAWLDDIDLADATD
ncbi:GntR family transcriptional regulator [Planctomicrobium sp. SH661]|uniref:GntR family transcriptional regulator n=1 Tax=Planctomicrobium sp. SH661 TaxID=3448124 RepID=UPI003F5BA978